jgi:hypothetical protein
MKCSSALLVVIEMKIKNTVRYHYKSTKIAIIEKNDSNKCWWVCGETETLLYCSQKPKVKQWLWKTIDNFFRKWNVNLPCHPSIEILEIYTKGIKTYIYVKNMHASVFTYIIIVGKK